MQNSQAPLPSMRRLSSTMDIPEDLAASSSQMLAESAWSSAVINRYRTWSLNVFITIRDGLFSIASSIVSCDSLYAIEVLPLGQSAACYTSCIQSDPCNALQMYSERKSSRWPPETI